MKRLGAAALLLAACGSGREAARAVREYDQELVRSEMKMRYHCVRESGR